MSKVDKDCAMRWMLSAFAQSVSDGFYVATTLHQIPGAGIFHTCAKESGIVEPVNTTQGLRNRFVDRDNVPTKDDAENLFEAYLRRSNPKKYASDGTISDDYVESSVIEAISNGHDQHVEILTYLQEQKLIGRRHGERVLMGGLSKNNPPWTRIKGRVHNAWIYSVSQNRDDGYQYDQLSRIEMKLDKLLALWS